MTQTALVCYLATSLSGKYQFSCSQFPCVLHFLSLPTPTVGFRRVLTTMCFTWYMRSRQLLLLTWQQGVPLGEQRRDLRYYRFPCSPVNTHPHQPVGVAKADTKTGTLAVFHTEILPIVFMETPGQGRGSTFCYATWAPHLPLTSSTVLAQKPWRIVGWFILLQLLDFHFYYLTWDGSLA